MAIFKELYYRNKLNEGKVGETLAGLALNTALIFGGMQAVDHFGHKRDPRAVAEDEKDALNYARYLAFGKHKEKPSDTVKTESSSIPELAKKYAKEYGLDPKLVSSVIQTESTNNPRAVSKVGAKGLMQIMPETGKWIASKLGEKEYDLFDPETNVRYGTWYLKHLIDVWENVEPALAAYNGGKPSARIYSAYLKGQGTLDSLNKETKDYVRKVLAGV